MASLKDVRVKITGVRKTKQITKAMNMVASAKLRGAQQRIERFRPYADKFYEMLTDLAGKTDATVHPLLEVREDVKRTGIVFATSDRGLCGGFNANLISAAAKLAAGKQKEGKQVKFYCAGRKGCDAIRKMKLPQPYASAGCMESFDFQLASQLGDEVMRDFLSGELDEVILLYGKFVSLAKQLPSQLQILPMAAPHDGDAQAAQGGVTKEYIYEPAVDKLLAELLPRFIKVQIYRGLLDTSASEHAARMTAMDNATRNCDDLVKALTLLFNKTRQAAITRDLMDIVGGAEALRG